MFFFCSHPLTRLAMHAPQITVDRARKLRKQMSPPEVRLWQCLRRRQLEGLKFRRQHPMGPWILDFFCAERSLAVEVDGWIHERADNPARDARRDAWLADRGVRVFRVSGDGVMRHTEGVLGAILAAAKEQPSRTAYPALEVR
jgi:very-short-patch-repair endonuclease